MLINCFTIESGCKLREIEEESALSAWRDGGGHFWVDLESQDENEMIDWLAGLLEDREILAARRSRDFAGQVLLMDEVVFFEYPVPALDDPTKTVGFACLCLDRLIVTLHHEPILPAQSAELSAWLRLPEPTTSGLICAMIINQSQRLRRAALLLRDRNRELARLIEDDPDGVLPEDILNLRRHLLDVDRIADEQMAVFDVFEGIDKPMMSLVRLESSLRSAIGNTQAAARRLERLDRAVSSLQQRYESLQQDKINRRLGVLTTLSAVFMPLTLIAGIYGMNFEVMPELKFEYGYPAALTGMAIIAATLIGFFRSRGWLDRAR